MNMFSLKNCKNLTIGFMGFGEIGSSLYRIYELAKFKNLIKRDPYNGLNDSLSNCDIVNVCIPYFGFKKFVDAIKELNLRKNCVVIIQSTLGVGTCDKLQNELDVVIVHSPVRGVHPNLTEGMLTFDKYLGVTKKYNNDKNLKTLLNDHLVSLNMKPVLTTSLESELAKIFSTTYYGICIAAVNDLALMCEKNGVDFDTVFTKWQIGYNEGYTKLGKKNVCRPVLKPIPKDKDGKQLIGGHCVVPNANILKKEGQGVLADFVLRYSDETNIKHVTGAKH